MRILVAEDEIDLAEALKMMLEMQKYSVEVVLKCTLSSRQENK